MLRLLPLALCGLMLSACAGGGHQAPVSQGRPAAVQAIPAGGYVVKRGDTVYGIARQHNLTVRDIIDANGLTPPYRLAIGQRLILRAPREHRVQRGDTLYGIARQYGVQPQAIARINGLEPPYKILVGQRLALPGNSAQTTRVATAPPPQPAPSTRQTTPSSPAQRGGQGSTIIVTSPNASGGTRSTTSTPAPSRTQTAQAPAAPAPSSAQRPSSSQSSATAPAPSANRPSSPPPAQPASQVKTAPPPAPPPASVPQPPPMVGGPKFAWPVRGEVIAKFGPSGKGLHNDGLNIAAPRGTTVVAAQNGVVAYAGNELRGFGNLLLIKHADGWMTAYAHNDKLLVNRGESVTRGQPIATVGSTGNVSTPQLHFELRQGSKAVDPLGYLVDVKVELFSPVSGRGGPPGPG
ncbi:LysM peptidoglycan-binding domain-containing M23 family metallopeptidase [Telmatospirillum sp. J64-1]|uniref:LysM peptidoglycan-binding domain-containing M23 family metallopeptidase n=1 Tax=Telmatospirillum sp. J64-1 TaxID=2502183 RepID=UPI001C8F3ED0|nr:LysM peptidoglycan-binding domain-containing M23 family metallopeptidase [Telmatospirillum sp. J64-1]